MDKCLIVMDGTKIEKRISHELVSFLRQTDIEKYFELPKTMDFGEFLNSKIFLVFVIKEGLPYSIFDLIQTASPFSLYDWAHFLNISYKSLQRYKQNQTSFKPIYTEKILELAEVLKTGVDVFGDLNKLKQWLSTENYALGNLKPLDLLSTSYGKEMVIGELVRINEGIFV